MTLIESEIPVRVLVLDPDRQSGQMVTHVLESTGRADTTAWSSSPAEALAQLKEGRANSLMIDIFALGETAGVECIEAVRAEVPYAPVCLLGTREQLTSLGGVPQAWRDRFSHYYWFFKDIPARQMQRQAEAVLQRMQAYLLTEAARGRLEDLRSFLVRSPDIDREDGKADAIAALDLAEHALESKSEIRLPFQSIVPGFDDSAVRELVTDTLRSSSRALQRTARTNIAVLTIGASLVVIAFIVAATTQRWEAVAFGGFGLAGVVASLITNPLRSISSGARRIVQIQVAYLGFLNQLAVITHLPEVLTEVETVERSRLLNEAISNVLESLTKHYGCSRRPTNPLHRSADAAGEW